MLGEIFICPVVAEVFAREPEASRSFVQPLTPPMSQAALDAHEAEKARKATSRDDRDAFADAASANFSFGFDVPRGA